MRMQSSYALASALGFAMILTVGGAYRSPKSATLDTRPHGDAAFRDGMFQARRDVESQRKPRIASGRWSTDKDRASFIAGYKQTYRELAAGSANLAALSPTEMAGYRDGRLDGAHDRKTAQRFHATRTESYRKADQFYRDAYANGYQEGYFSGSKGPDLSTISEKSAPFAVD